MADLLAIVASVALLAYVFLRKGGLPRAVESADDVPRALEIAEEVELDIVKSPDESSKKEEDRSAGADANHDTDSTQDETEEEQDDVEEEQHSSWMRSRTRAVRHTKGKKHYGAVSRVSHDLELSVSVTGGLD